MIAAATPGGFPGLTGSPAAPNAARHRRCGDPRAAGLRQRERDPWRTGAIYRPVSTWRRLLVVIFFIFFFGLVLHLRTEDKREGYPLTDPAGGEATARASRPCPNPKTFLLRQGGVVTAPTSRGRTPAERRTRAFPFPGSSLDPTGDPLERRRRPRRLCAPQHRAHCGSRRAWCRSAPCAPPSGDWALAKGDVDPRGLPVIDIYGATAGVVRDLWVDRGVKILRYLEVEVRLRRCAPFCPSYHTDIRRLRAAGSASRPSAPPSSPRRRGWPSPDVVTAREEDQINAFYAGAQFFGREGARRPPRLAPWETPGSAQAGETRMNAIASHRRRPRRRPRTPDEPAVLWTGRPQLDVGSDCESGRCGGVAAYFALLLADGARIALGAHAPADIWAGEARLLAISVVVTGGLVVMAVLTARTTRYSYRRPRGDPALRDRAPGHAGDPVHRHRTRWRAHPPRRDGRRGVATETRPWRHLPQALAPRPPLAPHPRRADAAMHPRRRRRGDAALQGACGAKTASRKFLPRRSKRLPSSSGCDDGALEVRADPALTWPRSPWPRCLRPDASASK